MCYRYMKDLESKIIKRNSQRLKIDIFYMCDIFSSDLELINQTSYWGNIGKCEISFTDFNSSNYPGKKNPILHRAVQGINK